MITFGQIRSVNSSRDADAVRLDATPTNGQTDGRERDGTHLSRRKYLRREMAELCSALIRAATEFPRDRKAKIITDVSARLSVPDEGADVRNEWIASTGTSRRRRHARPLKNARPQSMTNYSRILADRSILLICNVLSIRSRIAAQRVSRMHLCFA